MWKHSGPFIDNHSPYAEILEALPPYAKRFEGSGDEKNNRRYALLVPGKYQLSFGSYGGTMKLEEVTLHEGRVTAVSF